MERGAFRLTDLQAVTVTDFWKLLTVTDVWKLLTVNDV